MKGQDKCEREFSRKCVHGEGLKIECVSLCARERHKNGDKDKGRDSGGGTTNGGELSTTLRASVSQTESRSEIS